MRAFTLLEVLLSIGLASLLAVFSLTIGISAFQYGMQRGNQNTYTTALSFSRLAALHGICRHSGCIEASAQGVTVLSSSLELFEGLSYEARWRGSEQLLLLPASTTLPLGTTSIYFPHDLIATGTL